MKISEQQLKLFICYSRRDMIFADRLVSELEAAGFLVTIDRRDLPYGEEWQSELADFIRTADTVVWIVSPDSVSSKWCNWELGEVVRLKKRMLPIAITRPLPDIPEALGRVHIMPADGAFDYERHLPELVSALHSNRQWIKEQTRLSDRAREWLARGRIGALLLRGAALRNAEAWKAAQPSGEQASEDILDLILSSRQAETRRQRRWIGGALAVAIGALVLSGVAVCAVEVGQDEVRQAGWKIAHHADTGRFTAEQADEDGGRDHDDQRRGDSGR
jgi:hypothetical protein